MNTIRSTFGVPFGIPLSRQVLEFGAWLISTETELILKSRRVFPEKLLDAGYKFYFADIREAVKNLLKG
ncbi:DUF1731 domain-containing protein [Fulvivirga sp. 29W222]|uniref:DUF1731 domain-containing protein n=1 Tax=Fulvivirga marina TaxID=2494733 RepID=A0A937KDP1_9BACT|nr:DUF1731 domain-containing protein [Fulvivirga marina]MBL6446270.1 DUF1731 domain-containing protein [Fulvivirga marina]